MILLLVFLCCVVLVRVLRGGNGPDVFTGENSPYAFMPIMVFGCICARYDLLAKWCGLRYRTVRFFVEAALLYLAYKMYLELDWSFFWEVHFMLIPTLFIFFFVEFIVSIPKLNSLLGFLGEHSTNIFLVHTLLLTYFKRFFYSLNHFALITIVLLLLSLLISIGLEQLKKMLKYDMLIEKIIMPSREELKNRPR